MASRIMYIEPKNRESYNSALPGRIGRVTFSKSFKTIRYNGMVLSKHRGIHGNYVNEESGYEYWISGPKQDGTDRLFSGIIEIDKDVRTEYWTEIRKQPEFKNKNAFHCTGIHGGKRPHRL